MADDSSVIGVDGNDGGAESAQNRSRRQLLTLAGAAAVGGTALVLTNPSPAGAGNGDPILIGTGNTGTQGTQLTSSGGVAALSVVQSTEGLYGMDIQAQDTADLKLTGTGRLAQQGLDIGDAAPTVSNVTFEELVRSTNGTIWATAASGWKRINSLRVDNPSGDGSAFTPFRLLDTRDGSGAIGFTGKRSHNAVTNLDVAGLPQIPSDAVAVFGNVTTVQPSHGGFVTMWPAGAPKPLVSAVNFGAGDVVNNAFIVGLGTGGSDGEFSISPGGQAGLTVHVVIDINGYVQ